MVRDFFVQEPLPGNSIVNSPLNLYTIFHLNLFYSSIEEEHRTEVINRCYWPLLRLASERHVCLGIEATGMTLQAIAERDPAWVSELRDLISRGSCEFIGSGFGQVVGPLVPAEVNAANLRIGHRVYEELLGIRPSVALVNEQAFSTGLIQHYLNAGYRAIVMEWDNPAQQHPEWNPEWRYFPQYACGLNNEVIPLIWSKSIAFQQFQRYAHGETCLEDYVRYLAKHVSCHSRMFPLYANDAEIFDFRPNRYATEAVWQHESEWARIARLFEWIDDDPRFALITPSQVLESLTVPEAGQYLHLESPQQPTPVKKQGKYNIVRWAVTGRGDSNINASCWRAYDALKWRRDDADDNNWRELCYLWSSDFRTHITSKRWDAYQSRLRTFLKKLGLSVEACPLFNLTHCAGSSISDSSSVATFYDETRRRVTIETAHLIATLNCRRGLAIESLCFKDVSPEPVIVTLPHGFYDDISKGADFYSGHVVLETPGQHKITDLGIVEPMIEMSPDEGELYIRGSIATPLGKIHKTMTFEKEVVRISYELDWREMPLGSLRLGHVTLNPNLFDRNSLYVESHNGGTYPERFSFNGSAIEHGRPVSFLVSASEALGMTEGLVNIGDAHRTIALHVNQGHGYLIGFVSFIPVGNSYFCRLSFSGAECDDTSLAGCRTTFPRFYEITFSAKRTGRQETSMPSLVTTYETA